MNIVQPGLVLKTENYPECRAFYRDTLGLPVVFEEDHGTWGLTCLTWGSAYLMVETGGAAVAGRKDVAQSPMKIRINLADLDAEVAALRAKGVSIEIAEHPWGRVAEICDPDGNVVALREDDPIYRGGHV
ncbi:MAG: VOC family protein [Pseudomonadota bacterium]